jgi:type 1 glutamine amidotransferase
MNRTLATVVHPSRLPAFPVKFHREGGKTGRVADSKKIAYSNDRASSGAFHIVCKVKFWLYNLPFLLSSCYFSTTSFIRHPVLFVRKYNNMRIFHGLMLVLVCAFSGFQGNAQARPIRFRVVALAENGGHHTRYSQAAKVWLDQLARDSSFAIDYISNTDSITKEYLDRYQLFIQLDYPPYAWKPAAVTAFQEYMEQGKGGWIGFHHATLLGEFDGYPLWQWFSSFMGGIRFTDYIPGFADGKVIMEDSLHPCLKGLPAEFLVEKEEWYTYDKSPRPNVKVLARVDESTYNPASAKKMGDHPVIWSNTEMKAKNVYIFMGHSPDLFLNEAYKRLFKNSIFWAAKIEH